jgi:hypothetical protein
MKLSSVCLPSSDDGEVHPDFGSGGLESIFRGSGEPLTRSPRGYGSNCNGNNGKNGKKYCSVSIS